MFPDSKKSYRVKQDKSLAHAEILVCEIVLRLGMVFNKSLCNKLLSALPNSVPDISETFSPHRLMRETFL